MTRGRLPLRPRASNSPKTLRPRSLCATGASISNQVLAATSSCGAWPSSGGGCPSCAHPSCAASPSCSRPSSELPLLLTPSLRFGRACSLAREIASRISRCALTRAESVLGCASYRTRSPQLDAKTIGSRHRCAHSKPCCANVSTERSKKNAPMGHRCVSGGCDWCRACDCSALVPLVPIARAQLLVLVLAHLLAALLDHTAHGNSGLHCRVAAEVIRVQLGVKRPERALQPTPRVRERAPACDRGNG